MYRDTKKRRYHYGRETKMNEKFTLTIGEAADYFGIGVKRMRRLAEAYLGTISI